MAVRAIDSVLSPGDHVLTIRHSITPVKVDGAHPEIWHAQNVFEEEKGGAVDFELIMMDADERGLLEHHLPANFQYDQVAMRFHITVKGTGVPLQEIFTNGEVAEISQNEWSVSYPAFFNSSAIFFHLVPSQKYVKREGGLARPDGSQLPYMLYADRKLVSVKGAPFSLDEMEARLAMTVRDLESKLGKFPHPRLIVHAANLNGGREYSGAADSGSRALAHEVAHSYFGRGAFPADGNAGWIDEAVATWIAGPFAARVADALKTVNQKFETVPPDDYVLPPSDTDIR